MNHLERAEQQLVALSILIDGRNARNGYCTWPMIIDIVEETIALMRVGRCLAACDPPSVRLARERNRLKGIEDLADELARRTHAVRMEAYNPVPHG